MTFVPRTARVAESAVVFNTLSRVTPASHFSSPIILPRFFLSFYACVAGMFTPGNKNITLATGSTRRTSTYLLKYVEQHNSATF